VTSYLYLVIGGYGCGWGCFYFDVLGCLFGRSLLALGFFCYVGALGLFACWTGLTWGDFLLAFS